VAAAALLLVGALTGAALEPTTPLANYGRQSWVMENGLPQNTVQALVQTRDGFVWLGTEVGLVRFDGNGFTVFDRNSTPALPGNDVRCLLWSRDGALWIGTSEGLARWKDGRSPHSQPKTDCRATRFGSWWKQQTEGCSFGRTRVLRSRQEIGLLR